MKKFFIFLTVLFAIPNTSVFGTTFEELKAKHQVTVPHFSVPPKIDGEIENPLWQKGAILEDFTQYEPTEGAAPSEKTVTYIGYDRKNLYVAIRCFDSNPKRIRTSLSQRDDGRGDDEVTLYLDTFHDKKRAFVFQVNPSGVQTDGIFSETQRRRPGMGFDRIDKNWDTFFLSAGKKDEKGYVVELAIPFKSLRFPNTKTQVWGLQVMRRITRKNEEIYWFPRSRDINGFLIQAGTLKIEGEIEKGKNFEIMPVVTAMKKSPGNLNPEAGLNLKYGITSDMTADATFNPDFSQVEADMPQVDVNQRYSLYYPEKRPFFLEGSDFFESPLELVYTRKIVNPQWGIKLSGKLGKMTLGFLSAYDQSPGEIGADDEEEDSDLQQASSLRALVNIFRLKRDVYSESYIGFTVTDKEVGSSWDSLSWEYNRVAGVDGLFKFSNYYQFSFQFLGSQSKFDENQTGVVPALQLNFSRTSRHLNFSANYTSLPPDFEASTGFFRRKDIKSFNTRISYAFLPQNDLIVDIRPSLEYRRVYDFSNTLTDEEIRFSTFVSGWRQSYFWATVSSELERYEGIDFHRKNFRANFSTSPFSWLSGNISFSFGDAIYYSESPYLGYLTSKELRLTVKPLTNFRLFYNFENENFYKEIGGEKVYSINILSQRITYQMSRALSLRLITDYNDYYKELYVSLLLSYEYRPGTVFYLGVDDNRSRDESGIFRGEGRYYFIKFSYWWRI